MTPHLHIAIPASLLQWLSWISFKVMCIGFCSGSILLHPTSRSTYLSRPLPASPDWTRLIHRICIHISFSLYIHTPRYPLQCAFISLSFACFRRSLSHTSRSSPLALSTHIRPHLYQHFRPSLRLSSLVLCALRTLRAKVHPSPVHLLDPDSLHLHMYCDSAVLLLFLMYHIHDGRAEHCCSIVANDMMSCRRRPRRPLQLVWRSKQVR